MCICILLYIFICDHPKWSLSMLNVPEATWETISSHFSSTYPNFTATQPRGPNYLAEPASNCMSQSSPPPMGPSYSVPPLSATPPINLIVLDFPTLRHLSLAVSTPTCTCPLPRNCKILFSCTPHVHSVIVC